MSEAPGRLEGARRSLRRALRSSRLARLNHLLIPEQSADRDRLRRSAAGRLVFLLFGFVAGLSRDGRALLLLAVPVGCASIDVRVTQGHLLFAMLAGLLAGSLALRPWFRLRGVRAAASAPRRVAAGAPLRLELTISNEGVRRLASLDVEVPFLPWDGRWTERSPGVAVVEAGQRLTISAQATFTARGEHHLDPFRVAALVPLGLALGPPLASGSVRFLVVPSAAWVTSLRLGHRLPERRGAALQSPRAGEGELLTVRPYRPGDPYRHLHARTWARTGVPHVRQLAEERHDHVGLAVLVDGRCASERTQEGALSLAAGIAARLALHEGGLDALWLEGREHRVAPRSGVRALEIVLDRLALHRLSLREGDSAALIMDRLGAISSLVLVSAGGPARAAQVAERARARGVPLRWLAVHDQDDELVPESLEHATRVPLVDILQRRPIAL